MPGRAEVTEQHRPAPLRSGASALTAALGDALVVADALGTVQEWNPAAERMFGYPAESALGQPLTFLVPARFRAAHWRGFSALVASGAAPPRQLVEVLAVRADGSEFPAELTLARWSDPAAGDRLAAVVRDVTARCRERAELQRQTAALTALLQVQEDLSRAGHDSEALMALVARRAQELTGATGAVVELLADGELRYACAVGAAAAHRGVRLPVTGSLSGLCIATGQVLLCQDSETDERVDVAACRRVGLRSMIVVPLAVAGQPLGVLKVVSPVPAGFRPADGDTLRLLAGFIGSVLANAHEYETHALRDPLTGLANRGLLTVRLGHLLQAPAEHPVSVLYLDLERFKAVNDTLGHQAGDDLLVAVARRLGALVRPQDLLARVGGDEFVIVCEGLTRQQAVTFRRRVQRGLETPPYRLPGRLHHLSASVGLGRAVWGESPEEALSAADRAMYRDKHRRWRRRSVGPQLDLPAEVGAALAQRR